MLTHYFVIVTYVLMQEGTRLFTEYLISENFYYRIIAVLYRGNLLRVNDFFFSSFEVRMLVILNPIH